MRDLITQLFI